MSMCSRLSSTLALLALCLIDTAAARNYIQPEERHACVGGCQDWSGYLQWNTSVNYTSMDYYVSLCTNPLRLKSIYRCAQQYCSDKDIEDGLDFFNHTCMVETNSSIPVFADLAVPEDDLWNSTKIPKTYLLEPYAVSNAVIPDAGWAEDSLRTLRAYFGNFWLSYHYTWLAYGFWTVLFSVSAANRLVETVFASSRSSSKRKRYDATQTWLKRELIVSATFGKHCHEKTGWGSIPPRSESIIISIYLLMSIIMCFPAYDVFSNNNWWPEKTGLQLVRFIADRTAVLSIAQVPLIWLFSARNNPLRSFTSFTYASLNRFHRWVARLSVLLAIVHSVAWTINYICSYSLDLYLQAFQLHWFITGVIATITMSLMLPFGVSWLREKHYDLFLVSHISMAIVFLITLYFHIQIYFHYFDGYIWPCLAIWIYDRYVRIVRTAYMSAMPFFMHDAKAIATYGPSADIIRLDVSGYFNDKSFRPGVYYFIYLPSSLRGWQSHPFTLCSWTAEQTDPSVALPLGKSASAKSPRLSESSSLEDLLDPTVIKRTILIRPHAGYTRNMRDRIISTKTVEGLALTVLMEGPYGHRLDLSNYSDILLIAGGSGIVTAISHVHHLLSNGQTEVHLIWMTPQKQFVADVCEHELAAVMNDPNLHITVYLTAENENDTQISFSRALEDVRSGRPNLLAVMREIRVNCKVDLAIVAAGPPPLMDACRVGVVRLLKETGPKLDYLVGDTPWS